VVQLALTGQEVYLLVDDAEQLDESALQALLELAAGVAGRASACVPVR
jgi:DamX protein